MRRRNEFEDIGTGRGEGNGGQQEGEGEAGGEYFIVAVEDEKGVVVGTGGLVVERKL